MIALYIFLIIIALLIIGWLIITAPLFWLVIEHDFLPIINNFFTNILKRFKL